MAVIVTSTVLMTLAVGIVVIPLLLFLGVTGYLVWLHKVYAHLPSPPTKSFYLGHLWEYLEYQKEGGRDQRLDKLYLRWYYKADSPPLIVVFFIWQPIILSFDPVHGKELSSARIAKPTFPIKWLQYSVGVRVIGDSLLTILDYEHWKPRRALYDPFFSKSHLHSMIPAINQCGDALIRRLKKYPEGWKIQMKDEVTLFVMDVLTQVGYSRDLPKDDLWELHCIAVKCAEAVENEFRTPIPYRLVHPFEAMKYRRLIRKGRGIAQQWIDDRVASLIRGEPDPKDILSYIVRLTNKEMTSDMETLLDDFVMFFLGGHETTVSVICLCLILTLQHPEVLRRALDEIESVLQGRQEMTLEDLDELKYIDQIINETLRLYPPVPEIFKQSPKGMKLGGYYIPRDTQVTMSSMVTCQLEKYFEDPLTFNPDRFAPGAPKPSCYVYFPFGIGGRGCIGKHYALLQIKMGFIQLLQSFEIFLPKDYKLKIGLRIIMLPSEELFCTIKQRGPSIPEDCPASVIE